jgi:hypothetical protein
MTVRRSSRPSQNSPIGAQSAGSGTFSHRPDLDHARFCDQHVYMTGTLAGVLTRHSLIIIDSTPNTRACALITSALIQLLERARKICPQTLSRIVQRLHCCT